MRHLVDSPSTVLEPASNSRGLPQSVLAQHPAGAQPSATSSAPLRPPLTSLTDKQADRERPHHSPPLPQTGHNTPPGGLQETGVVLASRHLITSRRQAAWHSGPHHGEGTGVSQRSPPV